jgi:amphi-Trp domain-containing protein
MPKEQKQSFEFSTYGEPETIADYLESLAKQIRSGSASLSAGSEMINLHFGSPIKLGIEAEMRSRKGKGSLDLELSWREPVAIGEGIEIGDAQEEEEVEEEPAPELEPTLVVGDEHQGE